MKDKIVNTINLLKKYQEQLPLVILFLGLTIAFCSLLPVLSGNLSLSEEHYSINIKGYTSVFGGETLMKLRHENFPIFSDERTFNLDPSFFHFFGFYMPILVAIGLVLITIKSNQNQSTNLFVAYCTLLAFLFSLMFLFMTPNLLTGEVTEKILEMRELGGSVRLGAGAILGSITSFFGIMTSGLYIYFIYKKKLTLV